ncbi:MAG: hypothetical protein KDK70_01765 [Myxococcales bacterium]|nr:hypothetical protein [Myxococcales bacterium]
MNKTAWIATAVLGLVVTASSEAHAHPPYLQGVSDFVTAEIAAPACSLPGMTCGLCHHPSAGDPLADIVVDIMGIETTLRDRSFYEGLTGEGGWMHSMHMPGDMTHINMNRMALTDEALPAILAAGYDGDGDGVPDLEELSLGYNPLLAYDEGDPQASQLCDSAAPFPDVGGSTGTTGGETTGDDTTGTTSGGDSTTGDPDPDTSGGPGTSGNTTPGMQDSGSDDASGDGGSTGGSGAADGGDEGGCGCRTTGNEGGLLGLLLALGLAAGRRRRR